MTGHCGNIHAQKPTSLVVPKDAYFDVQASSLIGSMVYTIPYKFLLDHGKEYPWILWVVF